MATPTPSRMRPANGECTWNGEWLSVGFVVLEGRLSIEVEGREPISLKPYEAVTIPRGRCTVRMPTAEPSC
jgi:ethanolamine utilization protein EutQ (cupin superfamily)